MVVMGMNNFPFLDEIEGMIGIGKGAYLHIFSRFYGSACVIAILGVVFIECFWEDPL